MDETERFQIYKKLRFLITDDFKNFRRLLHQMLRGFGAELGGGIFELWLPRTAHRDSPEQILAVTIAGSLVSVSSRAAIAHWRRFQQDTR